LNHIATSIKKPNNNFDLNSDSKKIFKNRLASIKIDNPDKELYFESEKIND